MNRFIMAAAAAALLSTAAVAQKAPNSSAAMAVQVANLDAQAFVAMAGSSNMFEIQSSEVVLDTAQSDEVKAFAQHMLEDHGAASQQMMALAEAQGLTAPSEMDARRMQMLQQVKDARGEAVDAAYVDLQVMAHVEAVALFTAYSQNGDNQDLRAFATEMLPVLQEHLAEVQALDAT